MKKKLLAIVLCLSQLMPGSVVSAENDNNHADVLSGIGIIDDMEKSFFSSEDNLSRADYVRLIAGMINYKYDESLERSKYYRDIDKSHRIAQAADYLTDMGFLFGVGNSDFAPDESISYADAVTVLVKILGYDMDAQKIGGYPLGYMGVARSIGINIDVADNYAPLSTADASELVYKALSAEVNHFSIYDEEYSEDELTVLYKYHGLFSDKGIVEKVTCKSVNAGDSVPEADITVGGVVFEYDKPDAKDWLGYGVIYYYDSENMEIIYLEKERRCTVVDVDTERIEGFENDKFLYYENIEDDKVQSAKISPAADYYYNGKRLITTGDMNTYLPEYEGTVRITDSDGDGYYDYISIMDYYTMVVSEADLDNNIYYDKYPEKKDESGQTVTKPCIDLGTDTNKEVYVTDGNTGISLERDDIIAGTVLSVAESLDGSVVNILISDAKISGTVSGVNTEDGKIYVTINGEKHLISKNYIDAGKREIVVGMEAEFRLTAGGAIADLSVGSDYAYLINAYKDEEADIETVIFKILTAEGNFEKLYSAKKVTLNEYEKVNPYTVYDQLKNGDEIQSGLILYEKNSENKIKEIYTVGGAESAKRNLYRYYVNTEDSIINQNTRNIGGKTTFTADCLMFIIPTNPKTAKESEFDVFPVSQYTHFTKVNDFYYYKQDKESIPAEVLLKQGSDTISIKDSEPMFLVDTISEAVNADGEIIWQVLGYSGGVYVSYEAEDETYLDAVAYGAASGGQKTRISDGDMVRFDFNNLGKITGTQIFFDADLSKYKPPYNPSAPSDFNKACRTLYGYVYQRDGDFMRIVNDDLSTSGIVLPDGTGEIQTVGASTNVYEVDLTKKRGKIEKIKPFNIKNYKNHGPSCDKVFIYQRESARDIVIYR